MNRAGSVGEVLALYVDFARDPYDEDVSQLDHALQTAALARADGAHDDLVAAALLHDVGHLLDLRAGLAHDRASEVDRAHEARGAQWLTRLFPPSVTGPVALHVAAKRYRCAIDPAHRASLSEGSRRSLVLQGGPMGLAEVDRFEAHPAHSAAVQLRAWDDAGKVLGATVAPLADYRPLLERLSLGPERV